MDADRTTSLSDSELDFTDGGAHITLGTLPRHSHFFNSPSPTSITTTNINTSSQRLSLPFLHPEGRIDFHDAPIARRRERRHLIRDDGESSFSFDNRLGLAHDLGFLATMPELCDVTFLVGENRHPVCGVRAILAARSK